MRDVPHTNLLQCPRISSTDLNDLMQSLQS